MSQAAKLLELFRVDKQLRGLTKRLEAAEFFLAQQKQQLDEFERERVAIDQQIKLLRASIANEEGEAKRLDARIEELREQMNGAKTTKEYNAFLSELNTFKEQKSQAEERALASMSTVEDLDAKHASIVEQHAERAGIVEKANAERDEREAEIKDRLEELRAERKKVADELPGHVLVDFEAQVAQAGDEAMAPVEVLDRKNLEWSCSACMMAVPVEVVSAMLSGHLSRCPTCRAFLFTEEELLPEKKKPTRSRKKTEVAST